MSEKISRRRLLGGAAALASVAFVGRGAVLAQTPDQEQARPALDGQPGGPYITRTRPAWMRPPHPEPGEAGKNYKPTITLNGSTLPWKVIDGVKIMHLTCEEVDHEFIPQSEDNGVTSSLLGIQRPGARTDNRVP